MLHLINLNSLTHFSECCCVLRHYCPSWNGLDWNSSWERFFFCYFSRARTALDKV